MIESTTAALPQKVGSEILAGNVTTSGFYSISYDHDGTRLEVFMSTNKIGSQVEALARDVAILMSLAPPARLLNAEHARHANTRHRRITVTIAGAVADTVTGSSA